jgi:hypothetical protein
MAIIGRLFRFAVLLVLLVVMFGGGWAVGRLGLLSTVPVASLSDRERQFSERMQGSLVGYSPYRAGPAPEEDRYDISSVRRWPTIAGGSTCACGTAPTTSRCRSSSP